MTTTDQPQGPTSAAALRTALINYHDAVRSSSFGTAHQHREYVLRWTPQANHARAKALVLDHQLVYLELLEARTHATTASGDFGTMNALNQILNGYELELRGLEAKVR